MMCSREVFGVLLWLDFGSRVDYSASSEAIFLDTREAKEPVVFPCARGKGRAVRFRDGDGWKTVVLEGEVEFQDGCMSRGA